MSDITKQSLSKLVENIKSKKLSSSEITKAFVERSEKSKELNVYITEDYTNAVNKAKKFDEMVVEIIEDVLTFLEKDFEYYGRFGNVD